MAETNSLPVHFDSPAKKVLIVQLLQEYPVKRMAAAKAGVTETTLYRWMAEDEAFTELVEKAVELGKIKQFENILEAGRFPATWQASAWVLERLDPATFGKVDRSQVQVSGPGGGPVVTAAVDLSDQQLSSRLREVMEVLRQAGRLPPGLEPAMLEAGEHIPGTGGELGTPLGPDKEEP